MLMIGGSLISVVGTLAAIASLVGQFDAWVLVVAVVAALMGLAMTIIGASGRRKPVAPARVDIRGGGTAIVEDNRFKAGKGSMVKARKVRNTSVKRNEER